MRKNIITVIDKTSMREGKRGKKKKRKKRNEARTRFNEFTFFA